VRVKQDPIFGKDVLQTIDKGTKEIERTTCGIVLLGIVTEPIRSLGKSMEWPS
jgi:hypothetical protein